MKRIKYIGKAKTADDLGMNPTLTHNKIYEGEDTGYDYYKILDDNNKPVLSKKNQFIEMKE